MARRHLREKVAEAVANVELSDLHREAQIGADLLAPHRHIGEHVPIIGEAIVFGDSGGNSGVGLRGVPRSKLLRRRGGGGGEGGGLALAIALVADGGGSSGGGRSLGVHMELGAVDALRIVLVVKPSPSVLLATTALALRGLLGKRVDAEAVLRVQNSRRLVNPISHKIRNRNRRRAADAEPAVDDDALAPRDALVDPRAQRAKV